MNEDCVRTTLSVSSRDIKMTTKLEPTGFWLRLAFMLTNQVNKIVLDYDNYKPRKNFSNKTKREFR